MKEEERRSLGENNDLIVKVCKDLSGLDPRGDTKFYFPNQKCFSELPTIQLFATVKHTILNKYIIFNTIISCG